MHSEHPPGTSPDSEEGPRRSSGGWRRWGVLAVVASFVGIWGYVMYLSIFEGRVEPRDRLDDTSWTEAAEATCATSGPVFESLPFASEIDSPLERAEILDPATDELDQMIDRLDRLNPPDTDEEAAAVERWLADYRIFVTDRREYADAQRDPNAERFDQPFSVTDRGGYQLDVLIDDFARVNFMESCETPDDLG